MNGGNGSDRVALVTGAAKGIGFEVVRQLLARGVRVFLTGRNAEAGQKAAASLSGNVSFVALDIADPGSSRRAAEEVARRTDRLDVLVNNAGILEKGDDSILTVSPELMKKTFGTNALGPLLVTQAFAALLAKSATPRVINVSSGAGQLGGELMHWAPAYSISKTALNSVTQQLAAALPTVAVNSVCPGWVRTEMGGVEAPRSVQQGADTIVWLATDAPQSLTGRFLRDREVIDW